MLKTALERLSACANAADAVFLQRFFKTGPGEYGAGDRFRGIRMPAMRLIARDFQELSVDDLQRLLLSEWHEDRLLALLVMVRQFEKGSAATKKSVHLLYLSNTHRVNNWDLVDQSAHYLVGAYCDASRDALLRKLARSNSIWDRRIAIIATLHDIRKNRFDATLDIARILLHDPEDLIHKATGWMLREVGKRDSMAEELFLKAHCRDMPRTMLRYAIEKFPEEKRKAYLKGEPI